MKFESPLKLKNKVIQLAENEIFGSSYVDGFTDRLLTIDMVVDKDYDYEMYFKSADRLPNSLVNYDNRHFEFILKGHLPVEIEDLLEEFVLTKRLAKVLKSSYGGGWDDMPQQHYIFKDGVNQFEIDLYYTADVEEVYASALEIKLFELNKAILTWSEKNFNFISGNS